MGDAMSKRSPFDILHIVADFLQGLSESEISDLLRGQVELAILPVDAEKKRKKATSASDAEMQETLEKLYSAQMREAGFKILEKHHPTKNDLEALARYADLPVRHRDKISDLKERIVESTIGYRLRSQAIQGNADEDAS